MVCDFRECFTILFRHGYFSLDHLPHGAVYRGNVFLLVFDLFAVGDLPIVDGEKVNDDNQENYCCNNKCNHKWLF